MNSDPENFGALRKLLALKQLEQPPPGYFDQLAGNIVYRLEMGEGQSNIWERLAAAFAVRPGLAYAIVLTFCGTLAAATVLAFKMGAAQTSSQIALVQSWDSAIPALAGRIDQGRMLHVLGWPGTSDTAADAGPAHSLFQPVKLVVAPAAYRTGN
jgi:hypothetical protein